MAERHGWRKIANVIEAVLGPQRPIRDSRSSSSLDWCRHYRRVQSFSVLLFSLQRFPLILFCLTFGRDDLRMKRRLVIKFAHRWRAIYRRDAEPQMALRRDRAVYGGRPGSSVNPEGAPVVYGASFRVFSGAGNIILCGGKASVRC